MQFIETPIFTRAVRAILSDDEYRALQGALMLRPEQGALDQRQWWPQKGTLGSERRRETWRCSDYLLLGQSETGLLHALRLSEDGTRRPHPGAAQSTASFGSRGILMKHDDFSQLVASIKQAGRIRRGEMPPSRSFEFQPADIKAIRMNLGKSQSEFALMIGVSIATLQNWEQGRRHPEGPARALLKVAAENPEAVIHALGA